MTSRRVDAMTTATDAAAGSGPEVTKAGHPVSARSVLRRLRRNPLGLTGGLLLVLLAGACFLGPLLYRTDQTACPCRCVPGMCHRVVGSADRFGCNG